MQICARDHILNYANYRPYTSYSYHSNEKYANYFFSFTLRVLHYYVTVVNFLIEQHKKRDHKKNLSNL